MEQDIIKERKNTASEAARTKIKDGIEKGLSPAIIKALDDQYASDRQASKAIGITQAELSDIRRNKWRSPLRIMQVAELLKVNYEVQFEVNNKVDTSRLEA